MTTQTIIKKVQEPVTIQAPAPPTSVQADQTARLIQVVRPVVKIQGPVPRGGGRFLGFEDSNDATGSSAVPADMWTVIPNDGEGAFSNTTYLPTGATSLFDGSTGKIDPTELELGDVIFVRNDFAITPSVNGAHIQFRYTLGAGAGAYTLEHQIGTMSNGGGVPYRFQFTDLIYMGDTNTRDNEIGLEIKCSESATMVNSGSVVQLIRRAP